MSEQARMSGWHKVGSDDAFPIRQALPVGVLVLSSVFHRNLYVFLYIIVDRYFQGRRQPSLGCIVT